MAHYAVLSDYQFSDTADDIRGANVYGAGNDKLGKIKDVIFDHQTSEIRYLVVQAGDRKVLVPSDHVYRAAADEKDFFVDLDHEQLENLPDFDESMLQDERRWMEHEQQHQDALREWREQQEQLYKQRWHDGVVQHQHGSSHNITPPPDELTRPADKDLQPPMGSLGEDIQSLTEEPESAKDKRTVTAADLTPHRLAGKFPSAQQSSSKLQMVPESEHETSALQSRDYNWDRSQRWGKFEELLRKNRVDIQAKCPACAPKKAA